MKIAAFYSDSPFAGWVQTHGFGDVLERMGNEVVRIPVPPITQVSREIADRVNKPITDCDLAIVSGPEHLRKWIAHFYPDWASLNMPKVAWYHESFLREDYSLDYTHYEKMFDFHFFPDRADAGKYGGEFLPLGVDTAIFNPLSSWQPGTIERTIDVAFIGLMYPKRARFVEELQPHLGDIRIQYKTGCQSERGIIPAIGVWDFDGLNIRRSAELLAETYRRIKVFVTFPSLSNVLVAKVLESTACGCKLVCPKQPVLVRGAFEYENAYQCAQKIRAALDSRESHEPDDHRMELRFEKIFAKVGLCVPS